MTMVRAFFCIRLNLHLQLYIISSSGECYIKIYSNVTYIYGPPKAQTPDSEVFICASLYLHIIRILHANYNCKKCLKIPKGKSKDRQHKWPNKNGQQDTTIYKTIHTHKTKDRVTERQLNTVVKELRSELICHLPVQVN